MKTANKYCCNEIKNKKKKVKRDFEQKKIVGL